MEDLIFFEDEPREVFSVTKQINEKDFSKELAFHEASHFVIHRLLCHYNLGFSDAVSMYIDTKNRCGQVHGSMIENFTHKYWTESAYSEFREFYLSDRRRLKGHCLELMAGYASYKVFIENSEFFISYGDFESDRDKVKMYKLETVPHNIRRTSANRHMIGVSDFAKIKDRLAYIGIEAATERHEFYHKLLNDIEEIMKIRAVELAIRYVKNRLLKTDGKNIENHSFERVKIFVDDLIKRVFIGHYLSV